MKCGAESDQHIWINITRREKFSYHVFRALGHPPIDCVGALFSITEIDLFRHRTILFLGIRLELILEVIKTAKIMKIKPH